MSLTEQVVCEVIGANPDLMRVLSALRDLALPDAWLSAGSVRNALWNHLTGQPVFDPETDCDVVFFDPGRPDEDNRLIEKQLDELAPGYGWEVKNQVYMHPHSPNTAPYRNSCDAISKYPETCTAIGVRLVGEDLEVFAPYGLEDLSQFILRPTPHFLADEERLQVYQERLVKKNWKRKWSALREA